MSQISEATYEFDPTDANERLLQIARELHSARNTLHRAEENYTSALKDRGLFDLKLDLASKKVNVTDLDLMLRGVALEIWHHTHSKNLPAGIKIALSESIDYDEADAKFYCMAALPAALVVDKGEFRKLILAMSPENRPAFITPITDAGVRVPRDLAKAIEESGEPFIGTGGGDGKELPSPGA